MSQNDLQFIERALAHPWMFWVYFWKWPRIVRQACAEYDLLAKERDAAKDAHEQALRANKIVQDWIYTTHKLDMTADLRAIWTAGKRLGVLLLFLSVAMPLNAQLPPILRQQWTTNADPRAIKVISTNGVQAATNVWELDFTNTATVTVSAVSNANKVVVSFAGSGGSGESLWTNTGPFTALIADTNLVRIHSHKTVFGSNDNSNVTITNGGIATVGWGQFIGEAPADSVGNYVRAHEGGIGAASFSNTTNCFVHALEAGFSGGYFYQSSNCTAQSVEGGHAGIFTEDSHDCTLNATASFGFGTFFAGSKDSSVSSDSSSFAGGFIENSSNISVRSQSPSTVIAGALESANIDFQNKGGFTAAAAYNSRDIVVESQGAGTSSGLVLGSFSFATNSTLSGQSGIAVGKFSGQSNNVSATDGMAFGSVSGNERILAQGGSVHALAFGRDIASTNNWTFGIHYTNTVPLSLAVGANGTTQFRAASNSVVIRSGTAPVVGQILTATDTSGTVGWSNAPAGSDIVWTNFTATDSEAGTIYGASVSNPLGLPASIVVNHLTNYWGESSSVIGLGVQQMNPATIAATNFSVTLLGDEIMSGVGANMVRSFFMILVGPSVGRLAVFDDCTSMIGIGPSVFAEAEMTNCNRFYLMGNNSGNSGTFNNCDRLFGLGDGNFSHGATIMTDADDLLALGRDAMVDVVLTNCTFINAVGHGALSGIVFTNCTDITAVGNYSATNLILTGKTNIMFFGNVGTISPTNGEFWFGNTNNISKFRGNVAIRSATAPTVGQILTATDTDGTVGWSNAPTGGSGISSIYTNNALAGSSLTELEFTNSPTVTVQSTTNANRVTVSFTSAAGAQTPWTSDINAAAFSLTNFGSVLAFTNGSKIGATAVNTLSFTNAHLVFSADNTFDIGSSGANRPRDINVGRFGNFANDVTTAGAFTLGVASQVNWYTSGYRGRIGMPATGVHLLDNGAGDYTRLDFGGTSAAFPAFGKTTGEGHLRVQDATGATSTNMLIFGNTVNTTASTGMTMNRQTGRVRLVSGSQTYLVTNNLATANSIVTATVNSDDANALSVKAIPAAGLITLKVNAATAADTDISFFISAP